MDTTPQSAQAATDNQSAWMRIAMGDTEVRYWLINRCGCTDDALAQAVHHHVDPRDTERTEVTVLTGPPCGVSVNAVEDMTLCYVESGLFYNPIMDALASMDVGF